MSKYGIKDSFSLGTESHTVIARVVNPTKQDGLKRETGSKIPAMPKDW